MRCRYCGAKVDWCEHLPTDEGGTYTFHCGTVRDEEGNGIQSAVCKANQEVPRG